jgi:flagellar basal-body rod protein FlgC
MFRSLGIASSGIAAQRQRMETIAQNIANADVTRGTDGTPYRRRTVLMEAANANDAVYGAAESTLQSIGGTATGPAPFGSKAFDVPALQDGPRSVEVPIIPPSAVASNGGNYGVRVAGIGEDEGEGRLVYEPGHPDANADGYVRYPDIDTTQELVQMLDAKRLYEANASVFQTAKSMLRAALDI